MSIQINVTNKHAKILGTPVIVCGNSDYVIKFTFDDEWGAETVKTARFVYMANGDVAYTDMVFTGDTVSVPVLSNVREVRVGVFEGDLHTTTPAVIPCDRSIRCGTGAPADPTPAQYDQIMTLLNANTFPDWNANEGDQGHVKNRTHYVDKNGKVHKLDNMYIDAEWIAAVTHVHSDVVVLPEQTLQVSSYSSLSGFQIKLETGIVYEVLWNGESYICQAFSYDGGAHLGNPTLLSGCSLPATVEPFIISNFGGTGGFVGQNSGTVQTVSIQILGEPYAVYEKLPSKFLPDDIILRPNTAAVGQTIVVKSVDENGKPTEWEAADKTENLRLIKAITLTEDVSAFDAFNTDENGNGFALKKLVFLCDCVAASGATKGGEIRVWLSKSSDNPNNNSDWSSRNTYMQPQYSTSKCFTFLSVELFPELKVAKTFVSSGASSPYFAATKIDNPIWERTYAIDAFRSFAFQLDGAALGAGSSIEVWGVDA